MRNKSILLQTLFFILFIILPLNANILTQYRMHGIQNLEQQLDKELTNSQYWNTYLQNKDTSFGYLESYKNILYCDKSSSTLSLYRDTNKTYNLVKKYSAFTGKMQGDKVREGDLRTPVGVYRLVKKLKKVDSFYGPMAFVTSYPNSYDQYKGKGGHGIWIHGLPKDQKRDSFTKGCIAINNKNIECLDRHIDINKTILIINTRSFQKEENKKKLSNVLSELYAWRYSWLYNDTENYLGFYDSSFQRFDGMNLSNFSRYKRRVFAKNEKKTILFTNLNVIPYPGTTDIYKITFSETYKANSFTFSGDKVLIVKMLDEKMKIITER